MVEFPSQIPGYVKYDFLLTLIGIIVISYLVYLRITKVLIPDILSYLMGIVGLAFFFSGFSEMKNNYEREKELLYLEQELRKLKLKEEYSELLNKSKKS